ncbi:uncharacterized protein BX664DRAFT_277284 [Halteromyces radiatus]|uniref:uncharacterized protein n=1 Tax=Halteromyces radiatus TaxID=101107 RepID=UPI00221EE8D2|nr:uncharacterized protein BX664DRAFT_277284 [Halteromyces radiatus]KAI8092779.1 hypothetical protein BX664DRAFT_277284 [Halteromyces radiatus]
MNANAPTFIPSSNGSSSNNNNNKNDNKKNVAANQSPTDAVNNSPSTKTKLNGKSQASSTTKRFSTQPVETSTSSTNQRHQKYHHSNHHNKGSAAAKNKSKRQPRSTLSEQPEMLEVQRLHIDGQPDKKGRVSLNHLLSFSFPPRQQQPVYTPRRHKPTSYQPYNKERFINANFRFVVKPSGNYLTNIIEPDSTFDWDNIEQVLITGEEALSCPICLSPPTAARVSKCGHTFCLSCILHYLELREPKKQWRKCPICWESIYGRDLKSVRLVHPFAVSRPSSTTTATSNPLNVTVGDEVEFCLMQRSSKSTLALPLSDTWPIDELSYNKYHKSSDSFALSTMPWHFTPDVMLFGRFMLASPDYLLMENDRDIRELKAALEEAKEWGSNEEIPFIEAGLHQLGLEAETIGNMYSNASLSNAVKSAEEVLEQIKLDHLQHRKDKETTIAAPLLSSASASAKQSSSSSTTEVGKPVVNEDEVPEAYRQYHSQRAGTDDVESSNGSDPETMKHLQHQQQQKQQQHPVNEFNFYQAKDGQHIYLHPLDIRILKHEYGDYQYFPSYLKVKTTGVEETTLTEDIRKRFKYLGHLPLACDVTFIEIDMKPLVSKKTIDHFQNELKLRNKKRQDRIKREEKARKASTIKQQKKQVEIGRREEQIRREQDPFFQTYQPMTQEENDAMLKQALETSALEAQQHQHQPKTVWGTPAVAAEQVETQPQEWAEHIVVTQGRRKPKGKRR